MLAPRVIWSRDASQLCAQLIDENQPDLAHLQHVHRHITPSILEPLNRAGIPVIWTVHDYELICPEGHLFAPDGPCTRCSGHRYWEAVRHQCKWGSRIPSAAAALEKQFHRLKRIWERVDWFLCPSRFLAEKLVEFGIPTEKVVPFPNFIEAPRETGTWKAGKGWLYAGRLTEEKGVDVVIEAARQLPGYPLWICGTGPELESLKKRAHGLNHVHFMGHLPRARLTALLSEAGAVCVPSRWYENFPFAVLEAQALARPVVASRIGGIPEQIEDGVDGLLIPPGDPLALGRAITSLLETPELARRISLAGSRRVREQLAPGPHMDRILALYYEVLGSRGRTG
jgi:glycosyltransferase involved in cell wall biosynthesis